jgi:DNA-binding beta-propeller fold protein YncE
MPPDISRRRALGRTLWAWAGVLALALIVAAPAVAATPDYSFTSAFGSRGTGSGQFTDPIGIALSDGGTVYVTDRRLNSVQAFSSSGEPLLQWGTMGSGPGQFYAPYGIAVARSGDVFVADAGNARVQKFSAQGGYEGSLCCWTLPDGTSGRLEDPRGVTVTDTAAGKNIWVADYSGAQPRVDVFADNGGLQFSFTRLNKSPQWIAVDKLHSQVYLTMQIVGKTVDVYRTNGDHLRTLGDSSGPGQLTDPGAIALDSEGNVFVADAPGRIVEFASDGTFLTEFGSPGSGDGEFGGEPQGIAIDGADDVFAVDAGNYRVEKFAPTPFQVLLAPVAHQNVLRSHVFAFLVRPNRDCTFILSARLVIAGVHAQPILGSTNVSLHGLEVQRFHHTFTRSQLRLIAAAHARGRAVAIRLAIVVRDNTGHTQTLKRDYAL